MNNTGVYKMKKQIGVIFGSRSCEREVSIISAVQLMRFADSEKYDIIPVYIDEHGSWYTGDPLKEIRSYQPFRPDMNGIVKVFPDLSSNSGALLSVSKGTGLFAKEKVEIAARVDVFIIVMHGMKVRTAPCRACSSLRIFRIHPPASQAAPSAWIKS